MGATLFQRAVVIFLFFKPAGELVLLIVIAFPNHGVEHQKERWADLDTLEKVRKELVEKGRAREKQTVGDVAMVLEEVATRLDLPQDDFLMRLKRMGSVVAVAMRSGLTEGECRGVGSQAAMIDNAKQSRTRLPESPGFGPGQLGGGGRLYQEPGTSSRGSRQESAWTRRVLAAAPAGLESETEQQPTGTGTIIAKSGRGSGRDQFADVQEWRVAQMQTCPKCAELGVAVGRMFEIHPPQTCPLTKRCSEWEERVWWVVMSLGRNGSEIKAKAIAEFDRLSAVGPTFASRMEAHQRERKAQSERRAGERSGRRPPAPGSARPQGPPPPQEDGQGGRVQGTATRPVPTLEQQVRRDQQMGAAPEATRGVRLQGGRSEIKFYNPGGSELLMAVEPGSSVKEVKEDLIDYIRTSKNDGYGLMADGLRFRLNGVVLSDHVDLMTLMDENILMNALSK